MDWKERGKEASPAQTLEKIGAIYDRLGLSMETEEYHNGVKDCFSCRITVKGELGKYIGTNGKGMTRELSLASANGEMMERLSNRVFAAGPRLDDDRPEDLEVRDYPMYSVHDAQQEDCIVSLRKRLAATVKTPLFMQTPLEFTDSLLERLAPVGSGGKYTTFPFYSMRKKKMVYLPMGLINNFTLSNGLAAGNTYEEALVEGISEILERYVQIRVYEGKIIPPEVPDTVLDRYPHIRGVIRDIEKDPQYRVRLLDCSLGQGLPVVCGVIINRDSGTFGVKFGCHPNMAVALERVFTESFQGYRLERFSRNSTPDFTAAVVKKRADQWNSIKVGIGSLCAQLLMDSPTYSYQGWEDMSGSSNREKMWMLLDLLESLGGDVYIRDSGYLGFPSVQIYAEGVSEALQPDLYQLKMYLLAGRVQKYFLRLDKLTDEEAAELALFAKSKEGAVLENTISVMSALYFRGEMPGAPFEAEFLHAAAEYRCGHFDETLRLLKLIASHREYLQGDMAKFITACMLYVEGLGSGTQEPQVFAVVRRLCPDNAARVRDIFSDRMHCLSKLYPSVGSDKPTEADPAVSDYALIHDFYASLVREEREHPADPAVIMKVLERD